MRRRTTLVLLLLTLAAPARAQPEVRGPHPVTVWDAGLVDAAGARIRTRVVHPSDAPASGALVAVVHGYLRNGDVMMEMARDFASRGLVAIVPDMPCGFGGCDHDANAAQLAALLEWAVSRSAGSSPIAGRVDPERRALVGHSWGGLGTFLAASRDSSVDVWVGLDPQEDVADALTAAPSVAIPNAHLMAEVDGACNGEWGADVYAATASPHLRVVVTGSGHCDPEEPTDGACDFGCTAGDRATTALFRRYAVAFVLCGLGADPSMQAWVGGASFEADVGAGRVFDVMHDGLDALDCGGGSPPADAGAPNEDAGSAMTDGGRAIDAAAPRDAGEMARDASARRDGSLDGGSLDGGSTSTADGGCGCRARGPAAPHGGLALVAALAALLARRRR